ncbi:MAG: rhodanese-like domain-containing protein [Flavobacteriaceae bacterium]|nr:rhodanese-like domain-containing protein [Flavobacteriaceae bacterium]
MKYLIPLLLVFLVVEAGFSQRTVDDVLRQYNSGSVPYISVEELRMNQLNDKVMILDAREMTEYQVSTIPDAKFVGYNDFSVKKISEEIKDKDTPIVVFCSLGIRSETIGEKLKKAGFKQVKNLYGGIIEWKNNGYPVFTPEGTETDEIHTFSKYWGQWLTKGVKVYE